LQSFELFNTNSQVSITDILTTENKIKTPRESEVIVLLNVDLLDLVFEYANPVYCQLKIFVVPEWHIPFPFMENVQHEKFFIEQSKKNNIYFDTIHLDYSHLWWIEQIKETSNIMDEVKKHKVSFDKIRITAINKWHPEFLQFPDIEHVTNDQIPVEIQTRLVLSKLKAQSKQQTDGRISIDKMVGTIM